MQLPPEISLPETKHKTWDSGMQNLRGENAKLKEQLEEERKKITVLFCNKNNFNLVNLLICVTKRPFH